MQECHDWDKETFDKVNLDAYAAAPPPALPTAGCQPESVFAPIRTAANDECIWSHKTETQGHLFQRPHQSAWRDEFLERLNMHLTDSATEPTVKEEVLECTTSWLRQTACPCKCDHLRIGRHLLLRGYVAIKWMKLQERYYKDQHKQAKLLRVDTGGQGT
jgi:hypothetical protein